MKQISTGIEGITVELSDDGKSGIVHSNLRYSETKRNTKWNFGMDVLESLVLAHACAGINIMSVEYLNGLQTVVDKLTHSDM